VPARPPSAERIVAALLARDPPDPAAVLLTRLGVDRARTHAQLGERGPDSAGDMPHAPRKTL
jgi:hypothetical protein